MARQLKITINGTDRSSLVDWRSLKINKRLTSQVDTASIQYTKFGTRTWEPVANQEVIIEFDADDGGGLNKIFAGYITDVDDGLDPAGNRVYKIGCKDYNYLLDRRLVVATYSSQTPKQIIDALLAEYSPSLGITTTNVDTAPVIGRVDFRYITMRQAIEQIAKLTYKDWYIDENKDIHLFNREDVSSPFDVTDTNGNMVNGSLQIKEDLSNMKNRVVVRGGEYEGNTQPETFSGETDKEVFVLGYKPKISGFTLEVNSVAKTVGIEGIADETAVDAVINQDYHTLRFTAGNVPAAGATIDVTYTPILKIIVIVQDSASVTTYGYREVQEKDVNIVSKQSAKDYGRAVLNVYANPITDGFFETYTHGLDSGMTINIDSDFAGIDANYLIYEVVIKTNVPDNLRYEVKFTSARKQGILEVLQKLLTSPDRIVGGFTEQEGEKIEVVSEIIAIMESVSYQIGADYSTSDSIEISEDTAYAIDTPKNWVWGPYSPTGIADTKRPLFWDRESEYA